MRLRAEAVVSASAVNESPSFSWTLMKVQRVARGLF